MYQVHTANWLAAADCDWQMTDPSSRQRGPPQGHNSNCQTVTNIWSRAPDKTRQQDTLIDWLTVRRNVTLPSTWTEFILRWDSLLEWHRGILSRVSLPEEVAVVRKLAQNWSGWGTGTVQEPRERGTSAVRSRYQRTGEDTADCPVEKLRKLKKSLTPKAWRAVWVKNCYFSTSSRPNLGPIESPVQWVPGALSTGVKRSGVKLTIYLELVLRSRMRVSIHPHPHASSWRGDYLIKHGNKVLRTLIYIL
jgi:hypothetical protein